MLDETSMDKLLSTSLSADAITRIMRFCDARFKLLVLDCCHAGMVFAGSRFKKSQLRRLNDLVPDISDGSEAFVSLLASDRLESAKEIDALEGSFLTTAVCEALSSSFSEADSDGDGAIDISDMRKWVEEAANLHNRQYPEDKVPSPFFFGRERGKFYISNNPSDWEPYEIAEENSHTFVLIPRVSTEDPGMAWVLGKTPVTNGQYKAFVEETGYESPCGEELVEKNGSPFWEGPYHPWKDTKFNDAEQPVVCVNYYDAEAYARWMQSKFESLSDCCVPSSTLWDFSAFGFPYPVYDRKNWLTDDLYDRRKYPALVSREESSVNRFGVVDMIGNVWEWTYLHDGYDSASFVAVISGRKKVFPLRGGSFLDDLQRVDPFLNAGELQERERTKHSDLGFRIAAKVPIDSLPAEYRGRLILSHDLPRPPGYKKPNWVGRAMLERE